MLNEDEIIIIKEIVSKFLRTNVADINDDTLIDSSVMQGSVLFHRMISRINQIYSIEIDNYANIKTLRDLIKSINSKI